MKIKEKKIRRNNRRKNKKVEQKHGELATIERDRYS
jgi:hypothetical protein